MAGSPRRRQSGAAGPGRLHRVSPVRGQKPPSRVRVRGIRTETNLRDLGKRRDRAGQAAKNVRKRAIHAPASRLFDREPRDRGTGATGNGAVLRRTERICEAADVELVEVSSHSPARPDHAAWQGRVFSLHGDATVEGVRYRDLREATGYGTVAGLGGANCRHFFGPWLPGTPRMYEPDPPHPSGLGNDEVYALSQRQRARERSIRATKRELACVQRAGEKTAEAAGGQWSMGDIAEVERLKAKLRAQQKAMRDLVEDANSRGKAPVLRRAPVREWAGDMPKNAIAVSMRTKQRARKDEELKKRCAKKFRPVYMERGDICGNRLSRNYEKLAKEHPGEYVVGVHGSPKSVTILGQRSDHKVLAEIIRSREDYTDGKPVRLYSCRTGKADKTNGCFAQRLAEELGVPVTAPTDTIWVYDDGEIEIGREPGDNDGTWKTFYPKGWRNGN